MKEKYYLVFLVKEQFTADNFIFQTITSNLKFLLQFLLHNFNEISLTTLINFLKRLMDYDYKQK